MSLEAGMFGVSLAAWVLFLGSLLFAIGSWLARSRRRRDRVARRQCTHVAILGRSPRAIYCPECGSKPAPPEGFNCRSVQLRIDPKIMKEAEAIRGIIRKAETRAILSGYYGWSPELISTLTDEDAAWLVEAARRDGARVSFPYGYSESTVAAPREVSEDEKRRRLDACRSRGAKP